MRYAYNLPMKQELNRPMSRKKNPAISIWVIATVMAFGCSDSARAYVYRCTVNGRMVYTDIACAPNSAPAELPELTGVQAVPHGDFARQYDDEARRRGIAVSRARAQEAAAYEKKTANDAAIHKALLEDRVVPGMTPAQVEQVLNLPNRIEDQGGAHERWLYRNGRDRRTVSFKDGVVTGDRKDSESGTQR